MLENIYDNQRDKKYFERKKKKNLARMKKCSIFATSKHEKKELFDKAEKADVTQLVE